MDSGIEFGEIQHQKPDASLRPDQDPHFAVAPVGEIVESELPIFVDLDTMREMEGHARTNTNVELGGVMLGFQYHDENGDPFVLVTDCLRAEHYEATKGSFKFTHETWQTISRQRDAYPEQIQMVGWYHTHPDWGVFLSGMDLFICNNFFNRPLDVALVIDPCRDDRGWFQWENLVPDQTKRTGGFFLFASRFREAELGYFSNLYSGTENMPGDSRYNPMMSMGGQPIVNINDQRTPIQNIAIMAMLTVQVLFLGLIAWKLLGSSDSSEQQQELARLKNALEVIEDKKTQDIRNEAYGEIMASMLKEGPHPNNLIDDLVNEKQRRQELAFDFEAYRSLNRQMSADLSKTVRAKAKMKDDLKSAKSDLKKQQERYATLKKEKGSNVKTWMLVVGGLLLLIFGGVGGFFYNQFANENDEDSPRSDGFTRDRSDESADTDSKNESGIDEIALINPENSGDQDDEQ